MSNGNGHNGNGRHQAQGLPTFKLRRAADLLDQPPMTWLIDGLVPQAGEVVLYGGSGSGKSFIALDLSLCVATGRQWLSEYEVIQGIAIYVAAEGLAGMPSRLRAWLRHHRLTDAALDRWYCLVEPLNLMQLTSVAAFIEAAKAAAGGHGIGLVTVDTLARCMPGGDENSAMDIGAVIANVDLIRSRLGAAVLIVHHTGRNGEQERGSTALRGSADAMFQCVPDAASQGYVRIRCTKMKDAEPAEDVHTRRLPVAIDGADERSCVIVSDDAEQRMSRTDEEILQALAQSQKLNPDGLSSGNWCQNAVTRIRCSMSTFQRSRERLVSQGKVKAVGMGKSRRYRPASTYDGTELPLCHVSGQCHGASDT